MDLTHLKPKDFLQLIKGNLSYQRSIAESEGWDEVLERIDSLNIKYTPEQINHVKAKQWI